MVVALEFKKLNLTLHHTSFIHITWSKKIPPLTTSEQSRSHSGLQATNSVTDESIQLSL